MKSFKTNERQLYGGNYGKEMIWKKYMEEIIWRQLYTGINMEAIV